jgi:hypothetical protein
MKANTGRIYWGIFRIVTKRGRGQPENRASLGFRHGWRPFVRVTILLNGTAVVTNHASYWYENDTWIIGTQEGENTLEWVAGELCTHHWIQRIDLTPIDPQPVISSFHRNAAGEMQLEITAQPGRTNVIEFSEDLRNWSVMTNLLNQTGTLLWTRPVTASGSGFYRVLELAP